MLSRKKFWTVVGLAAVFLILASLLMPLVGSTSASLSRALAGESPDEEIFFYARLPRVMLAAMAGQFSWVPPDFLP